MKDEKDELATLDQRMQGAATDSLVHTLAVNKARLESMTGRPAEFCVLTLEQYEQLHSEVFDLYATTEDESAFRIESIHGMSLRVYLGEVTWQ